MNDEILKILNELKPETDFTTCSAFIDEELLDSFDIISLISVLEEKYSITVDGLDIIPENFQNIEAIIRLINKSKKA